MNLLRRAAKTAAPALLLLIAACHENAPSAGPAPASSPAPPPAPSATASAPDACAAGAMHVADYLRARPASGELVIVGYVSSVYLCPPCPKGAECKPCMPDHVELSEVDERAPGFDPNKAQRIRAFGDRATFEKLTRGARVRLKVRVKATHSVSSDTNDLELVAVEPC